MVDIAQMVEHRIVAPSVVGSIPTIHPKTRAWCNGNTPVSKTVDRSSTLLALAKSIHALFIPGPARP